MDLTYREVEERDFEECRTLLQCREQYSAEALAALPKIWQQWLAGGCLNGAVMEVREGNATPQIIQFGMSVFVTQAFMAEAQTADAPPVGAELTRRALARHSPVLDLPAIQAANSGGGLDLVVGYFGFLERDWTPEESFLFVSRMPESFLWLHEGFNFREMLQEYEDPQIVQFCLSAGFVRRPGVENGFPQRVGITREEAAAHPGAYVAKLFPYFAPHFGFSDGEQRVLRQALLGRDDEEIASRLCVGLSTVKKRWVTIYDCVSAQRPEMLPEAVPAAVQQTRGQEKRRRLLAYLRQHPEELRPYSSKPKPPVRP